MLRALTGLTLLLTGADHWTTYLCLRLPVEGWEVIEANPLADWLFQVAPSTSGGSSLWGCSSITSVQLLPSGEMRMVNG